MQVAINYALIEVKLQLIGAAHREDKDEASPARRPINPNRARLYNNQLIQLQNTFLVPRSSLSRLLPGNFSRKSGTLCSIVSDFLVFSAAFVELLVRYVRLSAQVCKHSATVTGAGTAASLPPE